MTKNTEITGIYGATDERNSVSGSSVTKHNETVGRDAPNAHPADSINWSKYNTTPSDLVSRLAKADFSASQYLGLGIPSKENPDTDDPAQTGYVNTTQQTLNHLFTFAANGKELLVAALESRGVDVPDDPTFEELARLVESLEGGGTPVVNNVMTFLRDTKAFDSQKETLGINQPALEDFRISNYKFKELTNIANGTPYAVDEPVPTYEEALTLIKGVASAYPDWQYHDLCTLYNPLQSGVEHPALSYKLDSGKPTFIIQIATHGNEKHSLKGVISFFHELMLSDKEELVWARNNLSIMAVMIHNPNGWRLSRRRNGTDTSSVYTGVNLNRNWDYFWEYAADQDKGSVPFSEIENQNFRSWLEENDRLLNGVLFYDYHSWWSRPIYGMLTDHNFNHGLEIQTMQRNIWRTASNLLQKRDWSGYTLNGGLSNMVWSERSSTRKPYAPYWAQQRMENYKGYCCQWEVPQGDESQAVNALAVIDTLHAGVVAIRDHLTPYKKGILIDKGVTDTQILNPNSLLNDWSTVYNRPQYMRSEGLVMVNNNTKADLFRPKSAAWPKATISPAYASYIHPTDETKSFFIVAGGGIEGNVETSFCYLEPMVPPTPPPLGSSKYGIYKPERAQTTIDKLPEAIESGAMIYANGYFWYFFGNKGAQGLSNVIYRLPVTTDSDDVAEEMDAKQWETFGTSTHYTGGVYRHSVIASTDENSIWIIGGRDDAGYLRDVVHFDTNTGIETYVGQIPYKNGWFHINKKGLLSDEWIYGGGWAGALCKDDVFEVTRDAVDDKILNFSRLASMPTIRRAASSCVHNGKWIILSGESAVGVYDTDLLEYDIATDTWITREQVNGDESTLPANYYIYSNELDDEEEAYQITNIDVTKAAGIYNPHTETLNIIAGQRTDATGSSPTVTFFEYSLEDQSLSARKVNDVTWGTFKTSTSYPIDNSHVSTVTSTITNQMQWDDPDELKVNPYFRSLNYVGPTWSETTRWRHKYLVPPRLKKVTAPVYAPTPYLNGSKVYAYSRLYGEGTKITSEGLQVIDNRLLTPRMVPLTGMGVEKVSYTIDPNAGYVEGAYFTPANERFDLTVPVCDIEVAGGYNMRLDHEFDSTAKTGKIKLKVYQNSTLLNTYEMCDFIPNQDEYTNMYKRDVINFRYVRQETPTFEIGIYGNHYLVDVQELVDNNIKVVEKVTALYDDNSVCGIGFYLDNVINVGV